MRKIQIADGPESLSEAVAERFVRLSASAVETRGRFSVALAGGSTPRAVYEVLSNTRAVRERVPWGRIDFFWGDERHVAPDHADSNYRMAVESLLSKVPVPCEHIHRIRAEYPDADVAALEYEQEIRATLAQPGGTPRFDLILLGLGADGHTASLFPGTPALLEQSRWCVANWVDSLAVHRITMTLPLINRARVVLFTVSGEEKAEIVRKVLRSSNAARALPAQLVRPTDGEVWWLLDRAAGHAVAG
jgi:6-phosphogluconolactonase